MADDTAVCSSHCLDRDWLPWQPSGRDVPLATSKVTDLGVVGQPWRSTLSILS